MRQRTNSGEQSRTMSGQWSKSENRAAASRSITQANRAAHQILKRFAQQQLRG